MSLHLSLCMSHVVQLDIQYRTRIPPFPVGLVYCTKIYSAPPPTDQSVEEIEANSLAQNVTESPEPKFTLHRCDDNPPVENAIFRLTAPNSTWMLEWDWVKKAPCNLDVILNDKGKLRTPLLKRIYLRRKNTVTRNQGRRRNTPAFLEEINHINILKGELRNEEVSTCVCVRVCVCV